MGDRSGIEWTDATWNPLRGCSRVSEGCRNCYAERVAARFSGPGQPYEGLARMKPRTSGGRVPHGVADVFRDGQPAWTGDVRLVEEHLTDPLRWRRPRRVFVNSMSDLFHERVPDEWIDWIFAVMALAPQHTFQILTKRPERMRGYSESRSEGTVFQDALDHCESHDWFPDQCAPLVNWPLRNVWLGVSVEDQRTADERIEHLRRTPAAVRFVSYEPALAAVDFEQAGAFLLDVQRAGLEDDPLAATMLGQAIVAGNGDGPRGIDWIIVGGESGPGARPFDVAWARSTIAACRAAGVACFVKQLGPRPIFPPPPERRSNPYLYGVARVLRDRKGGDPAEWPEDLRVREFPAVATGATA